ncbi:MFS transporter, partial [Devosia psychrophila]
IMFAACSIVMFAVQGIVFSPLVKASSTRWIIAPAFAVMALGLALIPGTTGLGPVLAMVSIVSGSAGVVAPLLAYWVAKTSQRSRGVGLGIQSAATSLGQSVGSAGAGMLYGLDGQDGAAFFVSAAVMAIAAIASLGLPGLLAPIPPTVRAVRGSGASR